MTNKILEALAAIREAKAELEKREPVPLRKVVEEHIADLRACVPTLRQYSEMKSTTNEIAKAADELEAALSAAPQPMQEPVVWTSEQKKIAWDFLKQELKNPDDPWTTSESFTYFGFFCWGIEAATQRQAEQVNK